MPQLRNRRAATRPHIIPALLISFSIVGMWHYMFIRYRTNSQHWHITRIAPRALSPFVLPHWLIERTIQVPDNALLTNQECSKCAQRALSFPIFKSVRVRPIFPSTLGVDYSLRTPIARIGHNVGIDVEGIMFPLNPFYPPLTIPTLIMPNTRPLPERDIRHIFLDIVNRLNTQCTTITTVDCTHINHENFFRKEITLTLSLSSGTTVYLRLHPAFEHTDTLSFMNKLLQNMEQKEHAKTEEIIDLRYPGYAIVSEGLCKNFPFESHDKES